MTIRRAGWEALSVVLPDRPDTLLLQAALLRGARGREAIERWASEVGDPLRALRSSRTHVEALLPLLHDGLEANGVRMEVMRPVLRAARLHEELRASRMRTACHEILTALAQADSDAVAVGGAVLAEHAYPEAGIRHCHDLDVLVEPATLASVLEVLAPGRSAADRGDAVATHASGLPVSLHTDLVRGPAWAIPGDLVRERARPSLIAGAPALVLDPADELLRVLARAAADAPFSLKWVPDTWFLLRSNPHLDWERVLDVAVRGRLATVVALLLGWQARTLEAQLPSAFQAEIEAASATEQPFAAEFLLEHVRGRVGVREALARTPSGRAKLVVVRRAAWPCADLLRISARDPSRPVPLLAAARAGRHLAARLRSRRSPSAA